jgi:hypothetical protein
MNNIVKKSAIILVSASLITSCESTGGAALVGGAAGAGVAYLLGERDASRLVGSALAGAALAVAVNESYRASARQRELAAERAQDRLRRESVRSKMNSNKVRKVAVVVPASEGREKGVMIMDSNGRPTDGKVYVPESSSGLKEGKIINLGSNKAILANSWHGV